MNTNEKPTDTVAVPRWIAEEITREHADPEHEAYNGCDNAPCLRCETLRAALDSRQPAGWRPIESAPRDGTKILVWDGSPLVSWWGEVSGNFRKGWSCNGLASDEAWYYEECYPSLWQPLPEPPETEQP